MNDTATATSDTAAPTNHAATYPEREKEVVQLCLKDLEYYKQSGTRNRINYYSVNSALVVFSSVLPIMILVAPPQQRLLQAATAAVVGLLTAVNSFYRFRENWIKNINAAHALNIEIIKFKGRVGDDYSPALEPQSALNNLMKKYEAIAETALTEWRMIVSSAPTGVSQPPRGSV